jgi:hypothetical protein
MRSIEELPGTLVLLCPDDPPELHNKIGTIVSELLDDNTVIVNLNKSGTLTLPVIELFVLRNPEEIEKAAKLDETLLPFWNFADIIEVSILANSAFKEQRMVGIELSRKDSDVFEYTMERLDRELGLTRTQQMSR